MAKEAVDKTPKRKTSKALSGKTQISSKLEQANMIRESADVRRARFRTILDELGVLYPDAKCALDFTNPFELVTATILSAQCTDERVNIVMKDVRNKFPTPKAMATADIAELEATIRSTGFFHQKALSLKSMASDIVEKFSDVVPSTMDELTTLRGVGRKTANVVMGNAFHNAEGIAVDTHVTRLAGRLGLSKHKEPEKIEQDLMSMSERAEWSIVSHLLILHGRAICNARSPKCSSCTIADLCPSRGMPGSV